MGGNRIVIFLIIIVIAGTVGIGLLPQSPRIQSSTNTANPTQSPGISTSFNLPSMLGLRIWPTATPSPTSAVNPPTKTPTRSPTRPLSSPTNTNVHIPTTAAPTTPAGPQPTPMTIGSVRPGNNLYEIANMAQAVSCTPAAFILAIKKQETGDKFFNPSTASIFRFYNTEGWWKPPYSTIGDVCYGYSYNNITGIIPSDAVGAGTRCPGTGGFTSGADQWIMGMMQMNQSEQTRNTPKFQQFFPGSTPDRRVLFDSMVLGGFDFKSKSTQTSGCNLNWSIRDIAIVSCRYYGACTDSYCENVCKYYGDFGGQRFSGCSTISNLVVGSPTGCQLR